MSAKTKKWGRFEGLLRKQRHSERDIFLIKELIVSLQKHSGIYFYHIGDDLILIKSFPASLVRKWECLIFDMDFDFFKKEELSANFPPSFDFERLAVRMLVNR